jgi:hypothetical protein
MEHVIVEGRYPEPTTPEALLERGKAQRFCFDLHRSHPVSHFLSLDGSQICCVFRSPDAESVRRALRSVGVLPPDRVWTASLEGPPDGDMAALHAAAAAAAEREALVLVERDFPEPVRFPDVQALEDRGAWCLDLYGIRFLGSFFARDQRRMICLYAAPDAEAVRRTNTRLALPFERAWPARVVGSDTP